MNEENHNTNDFEAAVREALKPIAGTFAYERMVQNHLNVDKYRPWLEYINNHKSVQDAVVFCSGCGSGNEFPIYFELGAKKIHGVEVEQHLVDLAMLRFKGTDHEGDVDARLYDGDKLPYEDNTFDIISSIHVIEHVVDTRGYLLELFRVLKPGGIVFLDFPNRFFLKEQHTDLWLIHLLPHFMCQAIVRAVLKFGLWIPFFKKNELKFQAIKGYVPPFPWQVVSISEKDGKAFGINVKEAYFHSYGPFTLGIDKFKRHLRDTFFRMTTFRLLLKRDE